MKKYTFTSIEFVKYLQNLMRAFFLIQNIVGGFYFSHLWLARANLHHPPHNKIRFFGALGCIINEIVDLGIINVVKVGLFANLKIIYN